MDILFTGATSLAARGFLSLLQKFGHNVTCLSRKPIPTTSTVVADLSGEALPMQLPKRDFDVVVHFASYVPLQERTSTWEQCAPTNVAGTARLLQWAEGRTGRVVLASSCAVYGAREVSAPITETDPVLADTYYAVSKYAQEQLLSAFCIPRSIPYVIMRLGYVYGPGVPPERAIVRFINSVSAGKDIILKNATSAGLHLVHTQDIADIGLRLLQKGQGIYNVVSEEFVSLLDCVQNVMRVCGRKVNIIQQDDPGAQRTNWYSLTKLQSEGLHSSIGLDAGIRTLVQQEAASCHA